MRRDVGYRPNTGIKSMLTKLLGAADPVKPSSD
jgi:hypothetical protein